MSISLTAFGFVVYYFIPTAFVKEQYSLALFLLMQILLMIILGMVFLSTLVYTYLEKFILWLALNTCCRRDRHLFRVVVRNMEGHQRRNNKTSVIFTLAMSFLLFSQSGFSVISAMLHNLSYSIVGADIMTHSHED